jgi:hypothetical protein
LEECFTLYCNFYLEFFLEIILLSSLGFLLFESKNTIVFSASILSFVTAACFLMFRIFGVSVVPPICHNTTHEIPKPPEDVPKDGDQV